MYRKLRLLNSRNGNVCCRQKSPHSHVTVSGLDTWRMSHAHGRLGNQRLGRFHHHHISTLRYIFLGLQVSNFTNIIWVIKLRRMRLDRCTHGLVGRPEGKRPFARPRRRWEDSIKVDLQEVGWGLGWIYLAQNRDRWQALLNAVMNFQVLQNAGSFLISLGSVSFLAITLLYGVRNKLLQQSDNYPCPVAGAMFTLPLYHTRFSWCVEVHMTVVWALHTLFKLFKQDISGTESTSSSVKTGNGTLLFSLAPVVKCHTQICHLFHPAQVFSYMPATSY